MSQPQKQNIQNKKHIVEKIPPRAYLTYCAHLFKVMFKRYHQELIPLLKPYIPDNANIMDVGAHAGQFTKLFSTLAPKGCIYAFEPACYTRSILSCMTSLHRLKRVIIIPLGLGDSAAELTLNIPIKSSGSLGYGLSHIGEISNDDKRPTYQETISIIKLDDYVADNNITHVDFIKADIEGWELRMLVGAEKTLAQHKPVLLLEISDEFLGRADDCAKDMLDFLGKLEYDVLIITSNDDGICSLGDVGSSQNISGNILCVPKSKNNFSS
jgi:FkbM family methyltransferase